MCSVQELNLFFNGKQLIVAACVQKCVECTDDFTQHQAGSVESRYGVPERSRLFVAAYCFNGFFFPSDAFLYSGNKMTEQNAVIGYCTVWCTVWCEEWVIGQYVFFFFLSAHKTSVCWFFSLLRQNENKRKDSDLYPLSGFFVLQKILNVNRYILLCQCINKWFYPLFG